MAAALHRPCRWPPRLAWLALVAALCEDAVRAGSAVAEAADAAPVRASLEARLCAEGVEADEDLCASGVSLFQTVLHSGSSGEAPRRRSNAMSLVQTVAHAGPPSSASSAASAPPASMLAHSASAASATVSKAGVAAGTGASLPTTTANEPGTAILYLLPILGFALALGAIAATVLAEAGWPGGTPPSPVKYSEPQLRSFTGAPTPPLGHLPPAQAGRGAAAAEGLLPGGLQGQGAQQGSGIVPPSVQKAQQAQYSQAAPVYARAPAPPPLHPPEPPPKLPPAPAVDDSPEKQIVVPVVPEGGVLGLNLSETDLSVTSFARPAAAGYGFRVGDRLLAINGVPVNHQDDFIYWLRVAMERNQALREPMVFTVYRGDQESEGWVGAWRYGEDSFGGGHNEYTIARADGFLLFEQVLPSGEVVTGALRRAGPMVMEADLVLPNSVPHGAVRLCLGADKASITSNLRPTGSIVWGDDIIARKVRPYDPMATQRAH